MDEELNEAQKNALQSQTNSMSLQNVDEIARKLNTHHKEYFTRTDFGHVQAQRTNKQKTKRLLMILMDKTQGAYEEFLMILKDSQDTMWQKAYDKFRMNTLEQIKSKMNDQEEDICRKLPVLPPITSTRTRTRTEFKIRMTKK